MATKSWYTASMTFLGYIPNEKRLIRADKELEFGTPFSLFTKREDISGARDLRYERNG